MTLKTLALAEISARVIKLCLLGTAKKETLYTRDIAM